MRSTIALATLVAFLSAPLAAHAQVGVAADVDLASGDVDYDFDYGFGSMPINGILPGDQPRIESDTKEKVVIGLVGVAVGFALAQLFNKSKKPKSQPSIPSIPRVSIPGRIPGDRDVDDGIGGGTATIPGNSIPGGNGSTSSGNGTVSTGRGTGGEGTIPGTTRVPGSVATGRGDRVVVGSGVSRDENTTAGNGTIGGDVAGAGDETPGTSNGPGSVATGRTIPGGSAIGNRDLGTSPGINVGRNSDTRAVETGRRIYSGRGHLGETVSAGTPR